MNFVIGVAVGFAIGATAGWLVALNNLRKAQKIRREAADMYERAMILAERAADRLADVLKELRD